MTIDNAVKAQIIASHASSKQVRAHLQSQVHAVLLLHPGRVNTLREAVLPYG